MFYLLTCFYLLNVKEMKVLIQLLPAAAGGGGAGADRWRCAPRKLLSSSDLRNICRMNAQ